MYIRDGDAATFLCCAHGRTLASDTIYIYNIIYTCYYIHILRVQK